MSDAFVKPPDHYHRDLDIKGNAELIAAKYLQVKTGQSFDVCLDFVKKETSDNGLFPLAPKHLKVLRKDQNQDRVKDVYSIDKILGIATHEKAALTGNMCVYSSNENIPCSTANYINDKLNLRASIKEKEKIAEQEGNKLLAMTCNNGQTAAKLLNNSVSGARVSPYNPLHLKTAHSSLTSTTMLSVSYSNSSTERFLSGNRHYYNLSVTIDAILSVTLNTDYRALEATVVKYRLYIPNTSDVFKSIKRCSKFYWKNTHWDDELIDIINGLTDLEKCAFLYTGDFFNLSKHNPDFVRGLLFEGIQPADTNRDIDSDAIVKSADADIIALCSVLCSEFLTGTIPAKIKATNPEQYKYFACTILDVCNYMNKYSDLFSTLFATVNMPLMISEFPNSIRRSVMGSDTDSNMFTVQEWIVWLFGKVIFSIESTKIAQLLCYLVSEVTAHSLISLSRQLGVKDKELYRLKMKSEFSFAIYGRANKAKHYATLMTSREGNVFSTPKFEIKGVGLKDSKIPKSIIGRLEEEFIYLFTKITNNKGIDIYLLLQRIANLEHSIMEDLNKGDIQYLSMVKIANKEAYKKPMASKYMHYDLWQNVYEKKFGSVGAPPYQCVKISTTLINKTSIEKWIAASDSSYRNELEEWLIRNNKTSLKMLLVPLELFKTGLPKEFSDLIDKRKIISELISGYYTLLEIIGFYVRNESTSILLMDDIEYRPEYGLPGDELK